MITKFKFRSKTVDEDGDWWEEEERDLHGKTAQEWAEETIAKFNSTLRTNESARELLEVVVIEANVQEDDPEPKVYIMMECQSCGHEHECDGSWD